MENGGEGEVHDGAGWREWRCDGPEATAVAQGRRMWRLGDRDVAKKNRR